MCLGFFTHSLTQVFESPLGALLIESCPTTFVLPNPAARTPALAAVYERMGFNSAEIGMIASLRPQRDGYYSNELLGKRPFSLQLSPLLLAMFARNTADDHAAMDTILAEHGREGFAAAWLMAQGFPEAATQIEEDLAQAWQERPPDAHNLCITRPTPLPLPMGLGLALQSSSWVSQSDAWPGGTLLLLELPGAGAPTTTDGDPETISAVEAVLQTAHWIIEQTPFDEAVQMGDLTEDMAEIEALVSEAQALGYVCSYQAALIKRCSAGRAPATTAELSMRLSEMRGHIYRG